jgi:hypothetical protein
MTLENKIKQDILKTFDRISKSKSEELLLEFTHLQFIQSMLYRLIYIYNEQINDILLINFVKQFERLDDTEVQDYLIENIKNNHIVSILMKE